MLGALAASILSTFVPSLQVTDAESFRRNARTIALARLVKLRVVLAPVLGSLALTFAFFEPTLWRRVVLIAVVVGLLSVSYIEWIRSRRGGLGVIQLPFNLLMMVSGQVVLVSATGGVFSPLVPVLVLMSFMSSIVAERRLVLIMVAGILIPAMWILAYLHTTFGLIPALFGESGALEHGVAPWLAATVYTVMLLVASRIGAGVRAGFETLFGEALGDRDRRLAAHAEQTQALSALSAEIAHELKNPLASVKGLGALVARDVDGKPAERMAVLRREVDRMQEILEELLNFSRPLVPLSMETVDARELALDIVRLHEGSAVAAGVRLRVDAEPATLTCDPRKVRQVLINLVQNALEASERNGEVTIRIAAGDRVAFHIDDRGPGLDAEMEGRLFDAGVTSKETGSGIGLVVARALARQHGGELEVANREGGGCRATLELPRAPDGAVE